MGHQMRQLLVTLCVASSLALVVLGGSDPSSGFHLQTLNLSMPPQPLRGPLGIWLCIPCWCSWCDVRGVGEAGKHSLPGPLLRLRGPNRLTTDAMGFEAGSHPCAPLYPCTPSTIISLPPSLCLQKRKRDRKKRERKKK
jgi:hypothetical protein